MSDYSTNIPLTKDIPNKNYTHLKISLSHSHGGVSYFDNTIQKAGYYLSFRPITIYNKDGYAVVHFDLFERSELCYKMNIYEKYRKSKKTEAELWKIVEEHKDEIFEAWETLTPTNVWRVVIKYFSKYLNEGE